MKFYIRGFFENPPRKFKFHENPTLITVTSHADIHKLSYLAEFFLK